MLRLNDIDSMYIEESISGFTKKLVDDGIVPRQVDLLLVGFGFAVNNRLLPLEKIKRHDLLRAGAIEKDSRLMIDSLHRGMRVN